MKYLSKKRRNKTGGSIKFDDLTQALTDVIDYQLKRETNAIERQSRKVRDIKRKAKSLTARRTRHTGAVELQDEKELKQLNKHIKYLEKRRNKLEKRVGRSETSKIKPMINNKAITKTRKRKPQQLNLADLRDAIP